MAGRLISKTDNHSEDWFGGNNHAPVINSLSFRFFNKIKTNYNLLYTFWFNSSDYPWIFQVVSKGAYIANGAAKKISILNRILVIKIYFIDLCHESNKS